MDNVIMINMSGTELEGLILKSCRTAFQMFQPPVERYDPLKRMNVKEAGHYLDLKPSTIYKLNSDRKIPAEKKGKKLYFRREDLDGWLQSGRVKTKEEISIHYTPSSSSNPSGRQGICPTGWHLPSDDEWCQLETYLDTTIICSSVGIKGIDGGGKMKEVGTGHWASPNAGANNNSGFTALPGGTSYDEGSFNSLTGTATFWSTTLISTIYYSKRSLYTNYAGINRTDSPHTYGMSGRCLKD
jgi:uncharacterized protein (TIGR02145 family)